MTCKFVRTPIIERRLPFRSADGAPREQLEPSEVFRVSSEFAMRHRFTVLSSNNGSRMTRPKANDIEVLV